MRYTLRTRKSLQKLLLLIALLTIAMVGRSQSTISAEKLSSIIGKWEGTLTYIDYNSGKPFTMPANLEIDAGRNQYELKLNNIYPNEPQANNTSSLKISKDGNKINGKDLISNDVDDSGMEVFVVEYKGKDGNDNKKALIHEKYQIGPDYFSIEKQVRYVGTSEWITRNTFEYKRK